MPKLEDSLIDRLTPRPEVREKARALLRSLHSKTGPGTGYDIGDAKSGLPAICAYIASKSAGYADITQEVAQKASCLAPKTFASTLRTVETALLPSANKTPKGSPTKPAGEIDTTAYATLISKHGIGQPLRVEKWMKAAQTALVALPRFRQDFASRLTESGAEVRIAVFYWVCRKIKLSTTLPISMADKYGVSLKVFNPLVKMMEDECIELKESIRAKVREMRKKKAKGEAAASTSTSKTPTSTPSHSRSASPTKSAIRDATLTPSLTSSAKRKVAFSLPDVVSASEDDEGVFAPETPSKKRPRRASSSAFSAAATRVMPVSKAAASSLSEEEGEDVEMAEADISTPSRPKPRLVTTPASAWGTPPVAGPSTPRRPMATPMHAYRTPPSARIQLLSRLTDDDQEDQEAEAAVDDTGTSEGDGGEDDALPPSRRFRPVFLDRVQWVQRAPRLAHDRAAAERRTRDLVRRWGHPFELLQRASAEVPAR